ncbi:MAG: DUF2341 domain-containing protein [Candidatus Pacearchaeota archaeon]
MKKRKKRYLGSILGILCLAFIIFIPATQAESPILSEQLFQYKAILNEPVKWKKIINASEPTIIKTKLPKEASNISVKIIDNESIEVSPDLITIYSIAEGFSSFFKKIIKGLTGYLINLDEFFIDKNANEVTLEIKQLAKAVEIEYFTPAPYAIEQVGINESRKLITIVGPETLHYSDVLAYTNLPVEAIKDAITLYHIIDNDKEEVAFEAFDKNNNGLIDYIEWNIPYLSNQSYELVINEMASENGTTNEPAYNVSETEYFTIAEAWQYRRSITIDNTANSNTLTDYQVLVILDTQSLISVGKMRPDCGDIRFTDSDGQTLLNYWLESDCNTTSTKLWVKVPSIPASSTATIYVYYGNPSATSASNIANTFIFGDDFEDGVINSAWIFQQNTTGSATWIETGGLLQQTSTVDDSVGKHAKVTIPSADYIAEVKMRPDTFGSDYRMGLAGRITADNRGYNLVITYDNLTTISFLDDLVAWGTAGSVGFTFTTGVWYNFKMALVGNNQYGKAWQVGTTEPASWQVSQAWTTRTDANAGLNGGLNSAVSFDDFRVRKYTSPEPTTSVGAEDQAPQITLNEPANNTQFNNIHDINFNFTATDDWNQTLSCSIYLDSVLNQTNNSVQNNTLTNFLINGISYGDHSWYINCTDGSLSNVSATRHFTIADTIAPAIQFVPLTESSGSIINRNYIQINVTASDSGIGLKNITIYLYNSTDLINSSNLTTSPLFVNFTGLAEGTYYFNATAYDNAENANSTETRNVTLDVTPPRISFSLSRRWVYVGEKIEASCFASDNLDPSPVISISRIDTSSIGKFTATCTAKDKAGNVAIATMRYEVRHRPSKGGVYVPSPSVCGDGKCDSKKENYLNCSQDCAAPSEPPENVSEDLGDVGGGREYGGSGGYAFRFRVKGQEHVGQIGEIRANGITLFIWSDPIKIDLIIGKAVQLDLDGNNLAELEILLEKIENDKAFLLLKELKEKEEMPSSIAVPTQPTKQAKPKLIWLWIIIGAILIVIIVAAILRSIRKKKV